MISVILYYTVAFLQKSIKKFSRYLFLQLFLSLCSLPILVSWGMPLSYAGIIGNILFAPFLLAFLFLCSLLFVCELCFIPNIPAAWLLDTITCFWNSLLIYGNKSWLLYCRQPTLLELFILATSLFGIIHAQRLSFLHRLILLGLLFAASLGVLTYPVKTQHRFTIPCALLTLEVVQSGSTALLIDCGSFCRRINAPSWAQYTLTPVLIKKGIRNLIICAHTLNTTTLITLAVLANTFRLEKIYFPQVKKSFKNRGWSAWQKLHACSIAGTAIHFITRPCTFTYTNYRIGLTVQKKKLVTNIQE